MELTKEIKAKLSPYAKTFEAKYGNIKDGITLYNCSLCAMAGNEKIGLDIDLGGNSRYDHTWIPTVALYRVGVNRRCR